MTTKISVRARYSPRVRVTTKCNTPSLTVQSCAAECDVNQIVAAYVGNGMSLADIALCTSAIRGEYADFINAPDFMQAQLHLRHAAEAFNALPAALRDRFSNSPQELVAFVSDDNNRAEAEKLGLVPPLQEADSQAIGSGQETPAEQGNGSPQ